MTQDQLACLRAIEAAGGRLDHEDGRLAPFCDCQSTDIFNQCHDAGWLVSRECPRMDSSTVELTKAGRAALAALAANVE